MIYIKETGVLKIGILKPVSYNDLCPGFSPLL